MYVQKEKNLEKDYELKDVWEKPRLNILLRVSIDSIS